MKHQRLLAIFILLGSVSAWSQDSLRKNGAYRNSIDFNNNTPLFESNFIFYPKNHKKLTNLYKVESEDKSVKRSTLRNNTWVILKKHALYLNAERIGMAKGYIKLPKSGHYIYFKGIPILSLTDQARINNSAFNYGLLGAASTYSAINDENIDEVNYVLCLESGMIHLLSEDYLLRILKPYQELYLAFERELDKKDLEVQLRYLKLLNEAFN